MATPIAVVDAFTTQRFTGNPAAVCIPEGPHAEPWMLAVAREMNVSETAFVTPIAGGFALRWFTPNVEVDLCGHATLATAHVLWERGLLAPDRPARFQTRSGWLTCTRAGDWIQMDFPATPPQPVAPPAGLLAGLRVDAGAVRYLGKSRFDYLVRLDAAEAVRSLKPDSTLLRQVPTRGIIVTASSDVPDADFVSRFFAPAVMAVDEDPVTGSSHCCLGPYWARELGKVEVIGYQVSARTGTVRVRPSGERVLLAGQAVTVWRGELA